MLKQAEAYAKENPEQFNQILARYNQILIKAKGGPRFDDVSAKHDAWFKTYWAAEQQAVRERQVKMQEYNRAGTPHMSIELWQEFPENLRSEGLNLYLTDYLLKYTPPNFLWDMTYGQIGPDTSQRLRGGAEGRPRFNGPGGREQGRAGNFNSQDRPDLRGPEELQPK